MTAPPPATIPTSVIPCSTAFFVDARTSSGSRFVLSRSTRVSSVRNNMPGTVSMFIVADKVTDRGATCYLEYSVQFFHESNGQS
jgi:hypothetical protein